MKIKIYMKAFVRPIIVRKDETILQIVNMGTTCTDKENLLKCDSPKLYKKSLKDYTENNVVCAIEPDKVEIDDETVQEYFSSAFYRYDSKTNEVKNLKKVYRKK